MNRINESIKCTVAQCSHHAGAQNYCSLDCITVGTHEAAPKQDQCTDSLCFKCKYGHAL